MSHAAHDDTAPVWAEIDVSDEDLPAPDELRDALAASLLRCLVADTELLRAKIHQARREDPLALEGVQHTAHKLHASAAVLGYYRLSAIAQAIEHLAAGVVADQEAHGPFAESAMLQQIAFCIEQLAEAVERAHAKSTSLSPRDPAKAQLANALDG